MILATMSPFVVQTILELTSFLSAWLALSVCFKQSYRAWEAQLGVLA